MSSDKTEPSTELRLTQEEFKSTPAWLSEEEEESTAWDGLAAVLLISLSSVFTCFVGVLLGVWIMGRV